ncbi:MAG: hypothetical protein K2Q01_07880 [Rickettsiales bacterium]|nr:hypothetical protein [Rickettsiales bacterium]
MIETPNERGCAQILPFQRPTPRKTRGRPRKTHTGTDLGTPELIMKRACGLTSETLDICLERGLITQAQHWCGIHLRWLFTLRNGAPSVRALDPSHLGGQVIRPEDAGWRADREQEYREAMQALALSGHALQLMNICVYNERPAFLLPARTRQQLTRAEESLHGMRKGLDILVQLWRRGKRS